MEANAITSIEAGAFQGLGSLTYLRIGGNSINCDGLQAELPTDCTCDDVNYYDG